MSFTPSLIAWSHCITKMPELPEVETIIRDLNNRTLNVLGARFLDVWTDNPKMIKKPRNFSEFKKLIKNKEIKRIWRRGKNIIFELAGGLSLLIHQKMTGHLLIGNWELKSGNWEPFNKGPLIEPVNRYIHLMFWLSGGLMLALSDLRKFAKAELWKTQDLKESKAFKNFGPEPLERSFTAQKLKEIFKCRKGKIKQVLMDQSVIAGIGNIYADEILWQVKINPLKDVSQLSEEEVKDIYRAIKEDLKKGVKLRGTSIADFRNIKGESGFYQKARKVYQREGQKSSRCSSKIKRLKIGGRSAHFCPTCQK